MYYLDGRRRRQSLVYYGKPQDSSANVAGGAFRVLVRTVALVAVARVALRILTARVTVILVGLALVLVPTVTLVAVARGALPVLLACPESGPGPTASGSNQRASKTKTFKPNKYVTAPAALTLPMRPPRHQCPLQRRPWTCPPSQRAPPAPPRRRSRTPRPSRQTASGPLRR